MVGGREAHKGGDLYTVMMIHVVVLQRTTQYCKTIVFQLKKKEEDPVGKHQSRTGWERRWGRRGKKNWI